MEEELAIFEIEMQRYKNDYLPWYKEDVEWRINLIYGRRRGVVAAWKKKIENKKRIIVKLQSSLRKLKKKKQALMNNMKKVVEAKEDDDDDLKLKRKIELWEVKDDIYITRKKAIIKGKSMIRKELELESLSKLKEYIGNPADLPPISDTDIEISDAEYHYEAKSDDDEPYEEEVKLKWRRHIPVKSAGAPSDEDDSSPIDDPEIF